MTKEYHRHDLIDAIDEMCKNNYPAKSGVLSAVLLHVLITVEVWDRELFKRIMETEMGVQERVKEELRKKGGQNND